MKRSVNDGELLTVVEEHGVVGPPCTSWFLQGLGHGNSGAVQPFI